MPDLDANANAIAIEHVKIELEGFERDTGVTEPEGAYPKRCGYLACAPSPTASALQRGSAAGGCTPSTAACSPSASPCGDRAGEPRRLDAWPPQPALLELICLSFGPRLEAWAACEHCGEKLELPLDATDFLAATPPSDEPAIITVRERSFRLPSSRDLARIIRANDPESASLRLINQCLLQPGELQALALEEVEEIEEAMAAADPLAEIRLALSCPACHHAWDEPLDVAAFLWAEIETRARLLLWEVHILASSYGWSETEILSLSEAPAQPLPADGAGRRRAAKPRFAYGSSTGGAHDARSTL